MTRAPEEPDQHDEVDRRLRAAGFAHFNTEAMAQRDWWGVIAWATTDRYWQCFDLLASLMTDGEYATTLREIWVATNGLPPPEASRRLLEHGRSIPQRMWMTAEDADTFDKLPDVVTVHRGCAEGQEHGWSWTLSLESAEYFASWPSPDDDRRKVVVSGTVSKSEIIALFSGNWEEGEVVVPGNRVTITRVAELK